MTMAGVTAREQGGWLTTILRPAGSLDRSALHRLLLYAASQWVFACLNTQPLENIATRALIEDCLIGPGSPQMLLQLGISRTTHPTGRRPAAELNRP